MKQSIEDQNTMLVEAIRKAVRDLMDEVPSDQILADLIHVLRNHGW